MNEEQKKLIHTLKDYKHQSGKSISRLALEIGVSWITVQRWLGGGNISSLAEQRLKSYLKSNINVKA